MIKAKAKKGKAKTGKKGTKRKSTKKSKKELNPAGVRNDISRMVEENALKMAQAVVGTAIAGQLAPAKYLLEFAGVYPAATDANTSTSEEDSLAKTLLERLNLPTEPVKLDEEGGPATVVIPAKKELGEGQGPVEEETKSVNHEGH